MPLTRQQRRWIKRRQAVEPVIGHLKHEHRLGRCWPKGTQGDALNAIDAATGDQPALADSLDRILLRLTPRTLCWHRCLPDQRCTPLGFDEGDFSRLTNNVGITQHGN